MPNKEEVLEEVVTVPDLKDLPGAEKVLNKEPVEYKIRTEEGIVRPIVVLAMINRQSRRLLEKELRRRAQLPPRAVQVRKPLTARETTEKVANTLIKWWEEERTHFPAKTLSAFLDEATGKILEQAYARGEPLPRDIVRQAIGRMWQAEQPKEAARAKN